MAAFSSFCQSAIILFFAASLFAASALALTMFAVSSALLCAEPGVIPPPLIRLVRPGKPAMFHLLLHDVCSRPSVADGRAPRSSWSVSPFGLRDESPRNSHFRNVRINLQQVNEQPRQTIISDF